MAFNTAQRIQTETMGKMGEMYVFIGKGIYHQLLEVSLDLAIVQ